LATTEDYRNKNPPTTTINTSPELATNKNCSGKNPKFRPNFQLSFMHILHYWTPRWSLYGKLENLSTILNQRQFLLVFNLGFFTKHPLSCKD
jgi:hypothetical protein